jgi:hypothetical protein
MINQIKSHETESSQGNTSELFVQIKRLNSLCNISNPIRALTDLNNHLTGAKSSEERFMTVLQFTQNITNARLHKAIVN